MKEIIVFLGDAGKMVDPAGILSICDPIHMVLIRNDPTGETSIVTSHFLEWRPVLSAPNSRCTMTVELKGVGMYFLALSSKNRVRDWNFQTELKQRSSLKMLHCVTLHFHLIYN